MAKQRAFRKCSFRKPYDFAHDDKNAFFCLKDQGMVCPYDTKEAVNKCALALIKESKGKFTTAYNRMNRMRARGLE